MFFFLLAKYVGEQKVNEFALFSTTGSRAHKVIALNQGRVNDSMFQETEEDDRKR